jgi:hypothetical protein
MAALRRLKEEDHEFETSLVSIVSLRLAKACVKIK